MTQTAARHARRDVRPWPMSDTDAVIDMVVRRRSLDRDGMPTHDGAGREFVRTTSDLVADDTLYVTSRAWIGSPSAIRVAQCVEAGQRIARPLREQGRDDLKAIVRAARLRLFGTVVVTDEETARLPLSLADMHALLGDPVLYDPVRFETTYRPRHDVFRAVGTMLGMPVIVDPRQPRGMLGVVTS